MSEFNLEAYLQQLNNALTIDDCVKVPIPPIQADQNYIFIRGDAGAPVLPGCPVLV